MHRLTVLTLLLITLTLVGCATPEPTLLPYPTLPPTERPIVVNQQEALQPIEANDAVEVEAIQEETPQPTPTPAILAGAGGNTLVVGEGVPLPDGYSIACQANTAQIPLALPDGTEVIVISRMHAHGERLLFLIDGGLYGMERSIADAAPNTIQTLIPLVIPGEFIGGRPVQELSDFAYDPETGVAYLLDKVGHVFWHEVATGQSTLIYRAPSDSNQENDPQIAAIELDERGLLMLDTANGVIWRPAQLETVRTYSAAFELDAGVDIAMLGDQLFAMNQRGKLMRIIESDAGASMINNSAERELALSVKTQGNALQIVDALKREVVLVSDNGVTEEARYQFAMPELGMLRDASIEGEKLYAVSDGELLVFPINDEPCTPPSRNFTYVQPLLYGNNVIGQLNSMIFPVPGDSLAPWPRTYPGARRLYRMGIHRGIDLYGYGVNTVFGIGHPVVAIADGEIIRSTQAYQPMTQDEWLQLAEASEQGGFTTDEALTRFSGRQVVIDHGGGVRSVYSHLDVIDPAVVNGVEVEQGEQIGTVGVTGTLGESLPGAAGAHLHFEIWINDRYLGYGLTVRETMWWVRTGLEGGE